MSIGSSLSGISFSGLSSGIDTGSIISKLMQLEQIPLQRLQTRQAELNNQQALFGQFRARLQSLSSAASSLNLPGSFNTSSANSSNTATATASATSGASVGSYALAVSQLAQAEKLGSAPQSDINSAMNLAGSFQINGKTVTITASDSLRTIAQRINDAGANVSAGIIDGGSGNAYLSLTAKSSGLANAIKLKDTTGSVLQSLGIVDPATLADPVPQGGRSATFSSATATLGTLGVDMDEFSLPIEGSSVTINPKTMSLNDVATALNGVSGVHASVSSSGAGFKLQVTTDSGNFDLADSTGFWNRLGMFKHDKSHVLVSAQDSKFTIDGVSLTNASNSIENVIPGVTLTLLKANATTPETTTITVANDSAAAVAKVKDFMTAYNGAIDFIRQYSQFDKDTFASGPLFGDPVAQQVESSIGGLISAAVPGLSGNFTNLMAVGFGLDDSGKLTLDESKLSDAFVSDPNSVSGLFRAAGSSANANLAFVSSSSKSKVSASGYTVQITQLATKAYATGQLAQTGPSTSEEILTFGGNLFGSQTYKLTIAAGSTAGDIVTAINSDSKLKDLVSASLDNSGKLLLTSKRFGSAGTFTAFSNVEASATNSGLGFGMLGAHADGLDIAGTINGEEAIGSGQFLTGKAGNPNTDGLQIQYTGTQTGNVGTIRFSKGVAALVQDMVLSFTDATNGLLTGTDQSITAQLDTIATDISDLQARLAVKQQSLQTKFAAMEQAISQIQSQGQRLSALRTTSG